MTELEELTNEENLVTKYTEHIYKIIVDLEEMNFTVEQYFVRDFEDGGKEYQEDVEFIKSILNKILQGFIGKPNTKENRIFMEQMIKSLVYYQQMYHEFHLKWQVEIRGETK